MIIDESHNLRNREGTRYAHVRDYIRENDSAVILLSATPYNKHFTDIGNQLRLFVDADADIGIRPEGYIETIGGFDQFRQKHTNALATSLAAFEHSENMDDWRDLMRNYMVRRTRSHIKKNYAEYDEKRKQHYLYFEDNTKFYFPHRIPKCVKFSLDKTDSSDQYALFYSKAAVQIVDTLNLPRYGLAQYLLPEYQDDRINELNDDDQKIIKNLSRAGNRLIGFARSGLFKRLESSGHTFLLSIKRHIVRNATYLAAWEQGGEFPIGDIFASLADETIEENEDTDMFDIEWEDKSGIEHFLAAGKDIYHQLCSPSNKYRNKFTWVKTDLFKETLSDDLLADCLALLQILDMAPKWDAATDRKLGALAELCMKTHKTEKLLIFTQFKDTADYLARELTKRGVDRLGEVFGGMEDISDHVKRFSPVSNEKEASMLDELRVLITTDTLSEGQNLQDAHIIVNFDLPWAIIRLVQRAGRVDRIGQKASEILCYCFLPEEGIDEIINLRGRLQTRINQNAELIGSDERFFEGNMVNLKQVYEEKISLEEDDDETDLISKAYDIWRQATKDNATLKKRIENLPDVVYSAKRAADKGAIAYIRTGDNRHILAQMNQAGEVISQSQSKILYLLECGPEEPTAPPGENHHELVAAAIRHVKQGLPDIGGQLGGKRSIRNRVYSCLKNYLAPLKADIFDAETLKKATDQIYRYPLKETARDRLGRQLRAHIPDDELASMVRNLYDADDLCAMPEKNKPIELHIICSMGLVE